MRAALHATADGLSWAGRLASFAVFLAIEIVAANARLSRDILTPSSRIATGVARFPLRCRTRFEIAFLANLLSLMPGTLVLEVRREPAVLYVHGMYAADRERFGRQLREVERRMLGALRMRPHDPRHAPTTGGSDPDAPA